MEPTVNRIGNVTIERVPAELSKKDEDITKMNFTSDSDSETSLSDEELPSDLPSTTSQSIKRKNQFQLDNSIIKKTKNDHEHELLNIDDESDLLSSSAVLSEEAFPHSDNEDTEYDSEEDSDIEEQQKTEPPTPTKLLEHAVENPEFIIEKLTNELGESSTEKPEEPKLDSSDYDYDITEKLKEMGEISVQTVKKGEKVRKSDATDVDVENEISVTPAKRDSGSDSELSSEKKIGNMRRNIREVMDETQLDEATLAAQRQEMERLRRVQEQQRIIREVQRQIALNRQNTKTQHRVISLLQGNSSLIKNLPSSSKDASFPGPAPSGAAMQSPSGASASKIGGTVLVKLPNGETKPMTRITKSGAPFEVVRLQKSALQAGKVQRNLIPIKKNAAGNLTPSVSIAPVSKLKIEPKIETDSESDFSDSEKKVRKVAGKPKDVVTISSSSDDDCIVLSEDEPEEPEPDEDPCNSGMHTNDAYNVPDEQGRVLINVGHPDNEAPIFLAPQIARVIKPHQIGGVRFLYDNVIESTDRFNTSTGFGCILAHSMGLGKTLQIVCFSDIFLRHTDAKTILCIMPINTLQNWLAEYNMWLPKDPANSPLLSHGEVRPRHFNLYVLNDSHKNLAARAKVIQEWHKDGGVLLIGYELYRLLSLKRNPKSKKKKKPSAPDRPDTPEDDEKNKTMFDEIHEALVKPGPDLVICDEGHRIKNSHASISQALKQIRSKRRIVLTGYPLQNNLLEYWCMVDFVRPNYLGTKTEFSNMFERPIQNGQCIDSTPQDIRLMRYRAHVLHSLLEGFVQRRSHAVLQTSLPQKEEYVLLVRMTEFQRKLYDTFMNEVVRTKTVPNPLKAFAVCCKIWNHPDVLYYFLKKQTADEAVDLDLEEVAAGAVGPTATQSTPKKKKSASRTSRAKKDTKKAANAKTTKPAASVTPNTNTTTVPTATTTTTTVTCTTQNIPPVNTFPVPAQNTQNYQPVPQNYQNTNNSTTTYPYPQQNYNYQQNNGEYYNQNNQQQPQQQQPQQQQPQQQQQNYPNYYPNNYPNNQEYGANFYPDNQKPEGYNTMYNNEQNYWQNNQQNQYYQQNGPPQNDYYQQNYNNQQDYYRQNQYPNQNYNYNQQQQPYQAPGPQNCWPQPVAQPPEFKPDAVDKKEHEDEKMAQEEEKPEVKDEIDEKEVDIKNAELTAAALVKKEDPGIPYDWAHELMKGYLPGCIENSAKMEIFFCILQESMALGDRILLFSQSLFTLNLIEEFLQKSDVPGSSDKWAKGKQYFRLDGSTSALEREKLINEYNSNPNIHLFLVSTRAGSLGINLVGANRVIVFDASWNPCHDTQAVCRVYRYGQKKPCFVYRIVMDNCLEKKIYDRQINKQGMADRVVDECNPDAHLSMKDVTNLCWDDEKDSEVKDFSTTKDKYIDVVMQKVLDAFSSRLSKEPFQHESLLIDRKEKKLSQAEKRLAKRSYELEKQANINSRPTYNYYNSGSGQGLQIRAIRSNDGSILQKPVASVRPMQSENMNLNRSGTRSRWIPAEVWQRQGMTAQEMTLPLDVVIPTNSPDRGSIVLKAGQKVLVLKSPKGIYMQLECGKIVAIKTAFKVRGGKAADKDEPKDGSSAPTTILKKVNQGGSNSSGSKNVPLPLKNNTAITVIPKQRIVKPFTQQKLNMRSIRQPVPNLIGRQVPMRMGGGARFTGKIQSIHRKVQLAKAKPYNMDKPPIDPVKIKTEPQDPPEAPEQPAEPQVVVPSSDEEIPIESHPEVEQKPESPQETPEPEPFPTDEPPEDEKAPEEEDKSATDPGFSPVEPYPQNFDLVPPQIETEPPKKTVFQVQNTPTPISSAVVQESGNSRSLKNYRHNFAGQKATKAQTKSAATSSAIHQLEQTTCAIGENKQPFQESLDNITNSYGADGKPEENIIDLDEKTEEKNAACTTKPVPPLKPFSQPSKIEIPAPVQSTPPQVPAAPPNQPQQEFPPGYGGYYGYGAPPVQPYPPPAQNFYPSTEVGPTKEAADKVEPPAAAPSEPGAAAAPPAAPGGPPAGGFAPYGQAPPPHAGYDMMYGQQNQYNTGGNYSGLPYPPNQAPGYQAPYQQQYDQGPTGYPGGYSAFHQYPTDPYGQYRNYHPPPQYSYPPGYEYNYNAGGFPPPPPPPPPAFVGPPYSGLPSNNPVP